LGKYNLIFLEVRIFFLGTPKGVKIDEFRSEIT